MDACCPFPQSVLFVIPLIVGVQMHQLMTGPGILSGCGSSDAPPEHAVGAEAAHNHSWSLGGRQQWLATTPEALAGSVLPSVSTHTGKKAAVVGPDPPLMKIPNNGIWPLRWPRLPLCKPSVAVTPDSSTPHPRVCFCTANPNFLPGSDLQSLNSSTQPQPTLVIMFLRLGNAGRWP